ncbi:hypothetical protein ABIC89_005555 [Variovorax boronicumulans]
MSNPITWPASTASVSSASSFMVRAGTTWVLDQFVSVLDVPRQHAARSGISEGAAAMVGQGAKALRHAMLRKIGRRRADDEPQGKKPPLDHAVHRRRPDAKPHIDPVFAPLADAV